MWIVKKNQKFVATMNLRQDAEPELRSDGSMVSDSMAHVIVRRKKPQGG